MTARITAVLDMCGGQPCIGEQRLPVAVVLRTLAGELSRVEERVMEAHPPLQFGDLRAALEYAARVVERVRLAGPPA